MNRIPLLVALLAASPALGQAPDPEGASTARILTLDEALRIGLSRQPQLRQAQANTEAARGRVDQALAPLLPQITGSAGWQHDTSTASRAFSARIPGAGSAAGGSNLYDLALTGKLLLWDFGQTYGRWRAARALATGQADSERTTRDAVTLGIRTTYFNAVAAKALVGVGRDTLANQQRHFEQIQAFVDVGTRPQIDLAQARTAVANARVQVIQAENAYATTRVQVEQAIGATDLGPWEAADESLQPIPGEEGTPEQLLAQAIAARPELAALQEQLRGEELTVRALRGGYGPSLGLSVGVTDAGTSPTDLSSGWNTSLTLTWPLFQGGATRGQVREARANASALEAQVELLRQAVRLEVEQARLAVRAAAASLEASQEAAQAAREQLTLAEGRYQTGVGNVIELGDSQVALTTALGQRVQNEFQLAVARSQLLKALGRE